MTSASIPTPECDGPSPEATSGWRPRLSRLWRRKVLRRALYVITALVAVWFALTSGEPWVPPMPAPTAEEAGAARSALWRLRERVDAQDGASKVSLTGAHFAGISALASHGLQPTRLNTTVQNGRFELQASHPLIAGRWLNLRATFVGKSTGFPSPRLSVGRITLPASLGRYPFELARALLSISGTDLAPLDEIVRAVVVDKEVVTATLRLRTNTGLFDRLAGLSRNTIDARSVVQAYCNLTAQQRAQPQDDFAAQVRRAFAFGDAPTSPDRNGAALIALAMLVTDERAGYLAGVESQQTRSCRIDPPTVTLHSRADLPKHWALSAALAVTQGTQVARTVGEWKELADSLPAHSGFALGNPSGFSFVDLAADRAGFRAATAAMSPLTANATARRLAEATAGQLLPQSLLEESESITDGEFRRRFGGLDADRYRAAVLGIDRALAAEW